MSLPLSIFSRFSNFLCTVICFVKVLVDSICQSKDLKNINLDICALPILTGKQFYLIQYKIEAWLFLTFFLSFTQSISFYTFCCHILKELLNFTFSCHVLKELQNLLLWQTQIIFVSATKVRGNPTNILDCYFWKWIYTLRHQTKYLSIYIYLKNKFSVHNQYLFDFHFSRNAKKACTD